MENILYDLTEADLYKGPMSDYRNPRKELFVFKIHDEVDDEWIYLNFQ